MNVPQSSCCPAGNHQTLAKQSRDSWVGSSEHRGVEPPLPRAGSKDIEF